VLVGVALGDERGDLSLAVCQLAGAAAVCGLGRIGRVAHAEAPQLALGGSAESECAAAAGVCGGPLQFGRGSLGVARGRQGAAGEQPRLGRVAQGADALADGAGVEGDVRGLLRVAARQEDLGCGDRGTHVAGGQAQRGGAVACERRPALRVVAAAEGELAAHDDEQQRGPPRGEHGVQGGASDAGDRVQAALGVLVGTDCVRAADRARGQLAGFQVVDQLAELGSVAVRQCRRVLEVVDDCALPEREGQRVRDALQACGFFGGVALPPRRVEFEQVAERAGVVDQQRDERLALSGAPRDRKPARGRVGGIGVALGQRLRAGDLARAVEPRRQRRVVDVAQSLGGAAGTLGSVAPPVPSQPLAPALSASGRDAGHTLGVELTAASPQPGPNTFTARVSDESHDVRGVRLRFTPLDDPEVAPTTLTLARVPGPVFVGTGDNLRFDGRWRVDALVARQGETVDVPLELTTQAPEQFLSVLRVPGRAPQFTRLVKGLGYLRVTPHRRPAGSARGFVTAFDIFEGEARIDQLVLTDTHGGTTRRQTVRRVGPGRFVADLPPGREPGVLAVVARRADGSRMRSTFDMR
jgi:hypothetical protein